MGENLIAILINFKGCPEQERWHLFCVTRKDKIRINEEELQGRNFLFFICPFLVTRETRIDCLKKYDFLSRKRAAQHLLGILSKGLLKFFLSLLSHIILLVRCIGQILKLPVIDENNEIQRVYWLVILGKL